MAQDIDRATTRQVTHSNTHDRLLQLGDADLRCLGVQSGDMVQVRAYGDKIVIEPKDNAE